MMLAPATLAASDTAGSSILARLSALSCGPSQSKRTAAITTLTAGPASATISSSLGLSGIRSMLAMPPNGHKRHVAGLNAVAARGEDVAELMQQHAEEDDDDEDRALPCRLHPAPAVIDGAEPGEEQKEGDVDQDRRSTDRSDTK